MNPDVRSLLTDHPYFYMDPQWQLFHGDWFRTGDLCVRDRYGFYRLVGRIKDMIRRSFDRIDNVWR